MDSLLERLLHHNMVIMSPIVMVLGAVLVIISSIHMLVWHSYDAFIAAIS